MVTFQSATWLVASRRLLSSLEGATTPSNEIGATESVRQQFRNIPVDPKILRHIQSIGVGVPSRRRPLRRRTLDKGRPQQQHQRVGSSSIDATVSEPNPSLLRAPPPFGAESQPVSIIANMSSVEDIQSVSSSKRSDGRAVVPEIALAGRSNVGKSTLLNNLLYKSREEQEQAHSRRRSSVETNKLPKGHKATVSSKPGETRAITIYQLASRSRPTRLLRLVDLPGYGFAYASPEAATNYQATMSHYLLRRGAPLKRLLLLIDARHGMKQADFDFLELLQQQVQTSNQSSDDKTAKSSLPPIQLVLTKCDLMEQTDLARRVLQVKEQLAERLVRETSRLPVMLLSARASKPGLKANAGLLELQKELAALVPVAAAAPTESARSDAPLMKKVA
ncbi:hypothetical protein MPSEU_000380600 [Mayamaea pseudoterrestris]|nr:hypothetical protein MPSEU_000380600 [Mayamaea pseudoterrestris]